MGYWESILGLAACKSSAPPTVLWLWPQEIYFESFSERVRRKKAMMGGEISSGQRPKSRNKLIR